MSVSPVPEKLQFVLLNFLKIELISGEVAVAILAFSRRKKMLLSSKAWTAKLKFTFCWVCPIAAAIGQLAGQKLKVTVGCNRGCRRENQCLGSDRWRGQSNRRRVV